VEASELSPETEFSEYGIDSLMSLTIIGRLREELELDAPSSLFADYPTVKELQTFLGESQSPAISTDSSSSDEPKVQTPYTIPEQDAENAMQIIHPAISDEAGVSSCTRTPRTKFLEQGVDSLRAPTKMGKLSETLEKELPQNLFVDHDTLQEIERVLKLPGSAASGARRPPDVGTLPEITSPASLSAPKEAEDFNNGEVYRPPHATSILLQGSAKTASKTLFLFPDGSGSATSYAALPRVSPDVVVYGLNCPWRTSPWDMNCSFETLSSKYLAEIRRRQPHGPYYFGGWSAGGISAYEAAQQLTRQGEKTARLILLDSPNPIGLENPPQRMYDFFQSLGIFGVEGKVPPSWLRPHFDIFLRLLDNYKIEGFLGAPLSTHIIYARDGVCKYPDDPRPEMRPDDPREMLWILNNRKDFSAQGWAELLGKENIHVEVLDDVNHFTMMDPGGCVHELSAIIGRAMGC
jgi:naphtho-gamma-pyrone polyketide synthase